MELETRPLDGPFGVELRGVNLRAPLAPETIAAIDRLMDENALVLIRDQPMSKDEQLAFTQQFGPLDSGFRKVVKPNARVQEAEVGDISNLAGDGSGVAGRTDRRIVNNIANQLWHSDSSFQAPAAKYSMLHSVRNPSWGGETEFADLRAAYDALDARTKARIEGLVAEHYALHSRFLIGDDAYDEEQRNAIPPAKWPVVRTNPVTGRKHLFIGAHAASIDGMTVPEGRMLLWDLLEHATQPQFRYLHRWQAGDTLIWDNRATLHRGRAFDLDEPRELRRTTTLDPDAPELKMAS